jgi:hypothetical protein
VYQTGGAAARELSLFYPQNRLPAAASPYDFAVPPPPSRWCAPTRSLIPDGQTVDGTSTHTPSPNFGEFSRSSPGLEKKALSHEGLPRRWLRRSRRRHERRHKKGFYYPPCPPREKRAWPRQLVPERNPSQRPGGTPPGPRRLRSPSPERRLPRWPRLGRWTRPSPCRGGRPCDGRGGP